MLGGRKTCRLALQLCLDRSQPCLDRSQPCWIIESARARADPPVGCRRGLCSGGTPATALVRRGSRESSPAGMILPDFGRRAERTLKSPNTGGDACGPFVRLLRGVLAEQLLGGLDMRRDLRAQHLDPLNRPFQLPIEILDPRIGLIRREEQPACPEPLELQCQGPLPLIFSVARVAVTGLLPVRSVGDLLLQLALLRQYERAALISGRAATCRSGGAAAPGIVQQPDVGAHRYGR